MPEWSLVLANEWTKLVYRRRFWVTGILALLTVLLFAVVTYHDHHNEVSYNPVSSTEIAIANIKQNIASVEKEPTSSSRNQNLQMFKQELGQMQVQLHQLLHPATVNWRKSLSQNITSLNDQMTSLTSAVPTAQTRSEIGQIQTDIRLSQYRLHHGIRPSESNLTSAYEYLSNFDDIAAHIFLPLLIIILVSDLVSGEMTDGTIKLLLVRPVSRAKILFGKLGIGLIASVITTLIFFAAMWAVALIIVGPGGAMDPVMVGTHYTFEIMLLPGNTTPTTFAIPHLQHAFVVSQLRYFVQGVLYTALAMMGVATVGLFCSTLFKSAMASTAVGMGAVVIGFIVSNIAQRQSWVGWLFTTHLDLWQNWSGQLAQSTDQSLTLWTGFLVILVWAIATFAISLWRFIRQDVQNA